MLSSSGGLSDYASISHEKSLKSIITNFRTTLDISFEKILLPDNIFHEEEKTPETSKRRKVKTDKPKTKQTKTNQLKFLIDDKKGDAYYRRGNAEN